MAHRSAGRLPLLPGLLLAVTIHAFHAMAVVTIAPQAALALDGRDLYGAFFSAYLLADLLGLVWAGGCAARWGPAALLGAGLGAFAAGLLCAGLAPGMPLLVLARSLEGFGGGVVTSVLYAVVNRFYDAARRPRVLAWMSGAWVLPGLVGPPLAGAVADLWGWRWVFLGMLPATAAVALLALPTLRGLGAPGPTGRPPRATLPRALALVAGLFVCLRALGRTHDPGSWLLGVAGAGLAAAAARRVLPGGTLLARSALPAAIAAKLGLNFAFFGTESFLPLVLRELRGWSGLAIGSVLTASALAWAAGALLQSRLAERTTARATGGTGAALLLLGIAGLGLLVATPLSSSAAFGAWAVAGLGMGLAYNTTMTVAMAETHSGDEGETSAALGIADSLGFAVAAGLGGALLSAGDRAGVSTAASVGALYVLTAVAAGATLAAAWRMRPRPTETRAIHCARVRSGEPTRSV